MVGYLATLGTLSLFACAALARPPPDETGKPCDGVAAKAVYFLTNDVANAVVALKVNSDGTLSDGSIIPTGGAGGTGVGADGQPAIPDPLFSQGALATSGNLLAAVNAGSNTLSLFSIDPRNPTQLKMVGEPVDTLGDFPVTVALSAPLSLACVANSGARAGVACFRITKRGLAPADGPLRTLDINQTTPPAGPAGTVSQAFFNNDKTALLVMVKGNPAANATGFMAVYPVWDGKVSVHGSQSSPNGTALLFGSVQVPGTSHILATDPSFGAALIDVGRRGTGTTLALTNIPGQMATCWATFSRAANAVFVTDGAVNNLVGINPANGQIQSTTVLDNGNGGMLDLEAAGDFVYALAPSNQTAVTVFGVGKGDRGVVQVQNFRPGGLKAPLRVQGMAVWPGRG